MGGGMVIKLKGVLGYIMGYITIVGLVGFSCFKLEESTQVAMFGTRPAKTAENWELVLEGTTIMDHSNSLLKTINNWIGWIQPLAFLSYSEYAKGADYYTKALKSQAFANAPELFIGQEVKFSVRPTEVRRTQTGAIILKRGQIEVVVANEPPSGTQVQVEGVLMQTNQSLQVDMRATSPSTS
jgi:hypothetical protein